MSVHGQQFGDYIHYHYDNYLRYGLAKSGRGDDNISSERAANFQSMIKTHSASILKSNADRAAAQRLENNLNFFGGKSKEGTEVQLSADDIKLIQQTVEKLMRQSWDIAKNGIDFEHLTVNLNSALHAAQGEGMLLLKSLATTHAGMSTHGENAKQTGISISHLQQRAKNTLDYITKFLEAGKTTGRNTGKSLIEIEAEVKNAKKEFENYLESINASDTKIISPADTQKYQAALNFSELLRKTAKDLMYRAAISLCEGELAEYVVAAVEAVLSHKINKETDKLLTNLEKATKEKAAPAYYRDRSFIKSSSITAEVEVKMEEIMKDTAYTFDSGQGGDSTVGWYGKSTQDKIDVAMTFGGASIKNYNLEGDFTKNKGISLVTQANLFAIIMQSPIFANHYLNVAGTNAAHTGNGGLLAAANDALKQLIFITAISGQKGKDRNFVDYFVLHDKASGTYQVKLVSDLLQRVERNLSLVTVKLENETLKAYTTWRNEWSGSQAYNMAEAYNRIAKLATQLSHTRVSAKINPNVITSS